MDAINFTPPPSPDTYFAPARPDKFNHGITNPDGSTKPAEFNMYVDDNMYPAVGQEQMRWLIRCSLQSAYLIFGEPNLSQRPDPIDFGKFIRESISYERTQIGYRINTRELTVSIPDEKRTAMLELLNSRWGPHRQSFKLKEAAELLGTLMSLSRVCKWGIFLFTNILKSINEMLSKNARRLMNTTDFMDLTREASQSSHRFIAIPVLCFCHRQENMERKGHYLHQLRHPRGVELHSHGIRRPHDIQVVITNCPSYPTGIRL